MRIGILTLPLHTNYGGILQAYALQTVLERMGHEVKVFSRKNPKLHPRHKYLSYMKRGIKKYILGYREIKIHIERDIYASFYRGRKHTQRFIDTYIKSYELPNFDLSKVKAGDFDAIVVGSDQIWRGKEIYKQINKNDKSIVYLSFADRWDVKRVAYAASFGIDGWEYTEEDTRRCADYAKRFDAISVREKSGVKLAKDRLGVNAVHVLDPTMLLSRADYIELVDNVKTPQSQGKLLCYILDKDKDKQIVVDRIVKERKLKPFSVNTIEDGAPSSVEKWLKGFIDAEYVVTDSFHACVFSIIFNKPFIVYGNKERGMARFNSLLEMFGLQRQLIYSSFDIDRVNRDIDFVSVNEKLEEYKDNSMRFLIESLDNR